MGDLYGRAVNQRGSLQRLMEKIPGFKGYMDRETRRDVDKIQREFCAGKLFAQKDKVKSDLEELITGGDIDGIAPFEKLLNRLDGLAQKIRNADRGYSGLFDPVQVDDDVLARIYEYDESLTEAVTEVSQKITEIDPNDKSVALTKVKETVDLLERVQDYFAKREEILRMGS